MSSRGSFEIEEADIAKLDLPGVSDSGWVNVGLLAIFIYRTPRGYMVELHPRENESGAGLTRVGILDKQLLAAGAIDPDSEEAMELDLASVVGHDQ